jgi:hypothetical protein
MKWTIKSIFEFWCITMPKSLLLLSSIVLIYVLYAFCYNFMLPKRRFWKDEQKM